MKFLLDQCTDARPMAYLNQHGHDAIRVGGAYAAGLTDDVVLMLAHAEGRVLITDDRDFGELVFRQRMPHVGVIFLRLSPDSALDAKIAAIEDVLAHHRDELDQFLVVTEKSVRVRRTRWRLCRKMPFTRGSVPAPTLRHGDAAASRATPRRSVPGSARRGPP
jgi:predicted nuclease of predicted toxin-antitoxin system